MAMFVPLTSLKPFDQNNVASLAEALVKFEKFEMCEGMFEGSIKESVLLRALTAASTRDDSKLKVVTFHVGPSKFNYEALAQARGRFAVNLGEDTYYGFNRIHLPFQ